jgi:hypothetical protein
MAAYMVERRVESSGGSLNRFNCHVSAILGFGHEARPERLEVSTEGQALCGVERALGVWRS